MEALHAKFIEDQYEILRQWQVVGKSGEPINIQVDAGYSDVIFDQQPHKITFIHIDGI
jgi:hypothetical protein